MNFRDQSGNASRYTYGHSSTSRSSAPSDGVEGACQLQRGFRPGGPLDLGDPGAHHVCPPAQFRLGHARVRTESAYA